MISINAEAVGSCAFEALNTVQAGQIFGVTSAGMFLMAGSNVLFLTEGSRRGPVSINLPGRLPQLGGIRPGDPIEFGEGRLKLPALDLSICAQAAQVWRAPIPEQGIKPDWAGAHTRLASLSAALTSARPGKGLSWLLQAWVNGDQVVDREIDPLGIFNLAGQVETALRGGSPVKAAEAMARLLGYGPGLTPSGDDFILGIVLMLNRWPIGEWGEAGLSELNGQMIAAARKSTTTLSATLIECAADGQADEGVVMAADYLASGLGEEAACVEALLGWGSNSGIDTLAGMAAVSESSQAWASSMS